MLTLIVAITRDCVTTHKPCGWRYKGVKTLVCIVGCEVFDVDVYNAVFGRGQTVDLLFDVVHEGLQPHQEVVFENFCLSFC